ncbi:hypothetical protein HNR00_000222 [Methylorubrum rhodinum]|uniref:Uncharacterized protein n=1 Tax=Methylorubrum rhodinum TaxID=29428 RepID=A0A840ZF31_9HYPH|nr:hypothetical protein [Methylorubrum rhodinum]MBB5755533.1 hypothetical protein [Methylorubrum rhodinum]
MSLADLADARGISLTEARALADREHWPKVFRLHDTFVLAPRCAA